MIFKVRVTTADGQQVPVRVRASSEAMARGLAMQQFPGLANANFVILGTLGEDEQTNIPLIGGQTGPLSPGGRDVQDAFRPGGRPTEPLDGGARVTNQSFAPTQDRERADPQAAIRAFLEEQGAPQGGVLGSAVRRFAEPAENVFRTSVGLSGDPQLGITQFLRQVIGDQGVTSGLGGAARSAIRGLAGLQPGQATEEQLQFINPEDFSTAGAVDLRGAAQAGINPFLRDRFGGSIDESLRRKFGDLAFSGNQPSNLAAFIMERLGGI
jgi:hypothetical protein